MVHELHPEQVLHRDLAHVVHNVFVVQQAGGGRVARLGGLAQGQNHVGQASIWGDRNVPNSTSIALYASHSDTFIGSYPTHRAHGEQPHLA